jgi:hypothetical protein
MWTGTSLPLVEWCDQEEDEAMFSVHCPRHGTEVLLQERRIESLRNTLAGIEVRWVCYCGHHGSFVTGRLRPAAAHIQ